MSEDISFEIFWQIFLFFTPIRLVWHGYNFYVQSHKETTLKHRFMTLTLMLLVGLYGYSIHKFGMQMTDLLVFSGTMAHVFLGVIFAFSKFSELDDDQDQYIGSYVGILHGLFGVLALIIYFFAVGSAQEIGFQLLMFLFLGGILLLPYFSGNKSLLYQGHLSERFGLFIIIVLAEMIYGLISGASEAPIHTLQTVLVSGGGFVLAIAIWWLYFDVIGHNPFKKSGMKYITHWTMLHLPLSLAIIYLGGMFLHIIFLVSSNLQHVLYLRITGILLMGVMFLIGCLSLFHEFAYQEQRDLSKDDGASYMIIFQAIAVGIVFSLISFTNAILLIGFSCFVYIGNIILFHLFFDPLDAEESFE